MRAVNLALAALVFCPALACAEQEAFDATFERMEVVAGQRLLFTLEGRSFRVPDDVHQAHKSLWFFLKRGTKVTLVVEANTLVKIERGWQGEDKRKLEKLRAELRRYKPGDRVRINGEEYKLIESNDSHVKLSPRIPGGDFGFAGETMIGIDKIETIEGPAGEDTGGDDLTTDELQVFGVEVGDTVELTLQGGRAVKGQVRRLERTRVVVLAWTEDAAPLERVFARADVQRVRHVPLSLVEVRELKGGKLTLNVSIRRKAHEGRLEFTTEVRHDVPGAVVTGLLLRYALSEKVGGYDSPDAEMTDPVPPLFPGKVFKLKREAIHPRYVDGRPQPEGQTLLTFTDPAARDYLIEAIAAKPPLDELAPLFSGLAQSGDPELLDFLVTRCLYADDDEAKAQASLALDALRATGDVAVGRVLSAVEGPEADLHRVLLEKGALETAPLPSDVTPLDHKRRLLDLLVQLGGGGVPSPLVGRLFELYRAETQLAADIQKALSHKPEHSVAPLFAIAVPPADRAVDEEAEQAAALLQELGRDALEPLSAELSARGLGLEAYREARDRFGPEAAHKVIEAVLRAARTTVAGARSVALGKKVEEARGLAAAGKPEEGRKLLDEVLAEMPDLEAAKSARPEILYSLAEKWRKAGDTGAAAEVLEEIQAGFPTAREALAALLVDALEQDLAGSIVARARPHAAAKKLADLPANQGMPGEDLRNGWIRIDYQGQDAYIPELCSQASGPGRYAANAETTPGPWILKQAERIRALAPALAARADALEGSYYAREATALYDAGQFSDSLPLFDKAKELAPRDPRLGKAMTAWLFANGILFAVVIVVVIGGVVFIVKLKTAGAKQDASEAPLSITIMRDVFDDSAPPPSEDGEGAGDEAPSA